MEPLPPSLADALRPVLPELADATIEAIGREVPTYARPLEGPFGRVLRVGVERALTRFVDDIADPLGPADGAGGLYEGLGRGEFRAGRSLDALLAAYRIGARLAWERFSAAGAAAGHHPADLFRLASAIFSYIDEVSAESVEGFAQERAAAEGERRRLRRALVRLLAREDVSVAEVGEAAREAGWPHRGAVAAVVAGPGAPDLDGRLGGDVVAAREGDLLIAFVADPDAPGRRAQLAAALDGVAAGVGPAVAQARAAQSLGRARAAHRLVAEGLLPGDGPARSEEHLAALLLHGADPALSADLATAALAPLDELRPAPRARLLGTLRAWLDHPGQVQRVAAELGVHPQTVRYRVAQLRELLGGRLEDPDARFELALAVRVRERLSPRSDRRAERASTPAR